MLTPSPTCKSCQAVAIHIDAALGEGETATTEEERGEVNEEPILREGKKTGAETLKTSQNNLAAL